MNTAPSIEYPYVYDSQVIGENYEQNNSVTGFADSTERKTLLSNFRHESIDIRIYHTFCLRYYHRGLDAKSECMPIFSEWQLSIWELLPEFT